MSETYTLDIDSDRGKLLVSWNDLDTLAKYAGTQAGFYLDTERDLFKLHDKHFKEWNQMFWSQRQNLKMFDFPNNAKIVDIGAGVAVVRSCDQIQGRVNDGLRTSVHGAIKLRTPK